MIELGESRDINLATYQRVAFRGVGVRIADAAISRIEARRNVLLSYISSQPQRPTYGVNVGAGDGSFDALDEGTRRSYESGLNSATSFGAPLPERVVRGIVLARLSSFLDGSAGVSAELALHVAEMLGGSLPNVPAEGSRGSGEVLQLGHLFSGVPGVIALGPKESMSLVNGSPAAAALAADVAVWMPATIDMFLRCAALACDALDASEDHFDPDLGKLWGYPEERRVLDELHTLLGEPARPRHEHQARVSVRILPRIHGIAVLAADRLAEDANVALSHVGDNPALIVDNRGAKVLSNGGFHNQRALVATDAATRSMADLTQLGQHLIHALYQSPTAMPGQDNLSLGISYMVAADWSEEARLRTAPTLLSFAAVGQNDVPFPMLAAWRAAVRVRECLIAQTAVLAAMATQSLYSTARTAAPRLASWRS